MNDDFKNIGLLKKATGPDNMTRMWADAKKKDKNLKEQLVNVRVRRGSGLLGQKVIVLMVQVFSKNMSGRIKQAEKEMTTSNTMPMPENRNKRSTCCRADWLASSMRSSASASGICGIARNKRQSSNASFCCTSRRGATPRSTTS